MPELERYMNGRIQAPPGRNFSTTVPYSFHHIDCDGYTIDLQVIGLDEDFLWFDWEGIVSWEVPGNSDVLQIIQAGMVDPPPPPPRAPAGMTERHPNKENYYRCGEASGPGPVRGPSARRVSRRLSRRDLLLRRRS